MGTIAEHQKRNKNRSSYTSILKYTGLFGGVQGFNILISIIRNKCAAVLIGAAGIGLTDILNRTSDFIGSITNLGLSFSGVRQLSEDFATGEEQKIHDTIDTIRAWCVGTGIIGCSCYIPRTKFNARLSGNFAHDSHAHRVWGRNSCFKRYT